VRIIFCVSQHFYWQHKHEQKEVKTTKLFRIAVAGYVYEIVRSTSAIAEHAVTDRAKSASYSAAFHLNNRFVVGPTTKFVSQNIYAVNFQQMEIQLYQYWQPGIKQTGFTAVIKDWFSIQLIRLKKEPGDWHTVFTLVAAADVVAPTFCCTTSIAWRMRDICASVSRRRRFSSVISSSSTAASN
jgi:hypothetical protein